MTQHVALLREVESAVGLLHAGLEELNRLNAANAFYRLPLGLIAQGLERLCKVAIALEALERSSGLPSPNVMKNKYGHDLIKLMDGVGLIIAKEDYRTRSKGADEDASFLMGDARLRELVAIVSAHGDAARYSDMDAFLAAESKPGPPDPTERFDRLTMEIIKERENWMADIRTEAYNEFFPYVNTNLTRLIPKAPKLGPSGSPDRRSGRGGV